MFHFPSKKALGQSLKCKVNHLIPGEGIEVTYNSNSTGQDILDSVANQLDLLDKDYYGLKLHDHFQWIDLTKSVVKQTKGIANVAFTLRFKYYPAEPALLANESTRYYLYHQLRSDLLEGRLRPDCQETAAYMIACILQSELGDADINSRENYVTEYKFVPNQSEDLEWASIRTHQTEDFLGLNPSDAELNLLKKACQSDMYGIDPYPVKEGNSHNHFLIGVNHRGISTFQESKRTNLFVWGEIERISMDNKLVLIYCRKIETKNDRPQKTRTLFAFRCPSHEHAHNFWKISTEHRFFFTLDTTPETPIVTNTGGFFKKNHKLRYAGRVERDMLRDVTPEVRSAGVRRSRSLIAKTNGNSMWEGMKHENNNLHNSTSNLYRSAGLNKTMPNDMDCLREEDEDDGAMSNQDRGRTSIDRQGQDARRASTQAPSGKDPVRAAFNRKTILTSKTDSASQAVRKGSQVFMDIDQHNNDFLRASIFLVLTLIAILLIILLISDTDRPNSVSLLVQKLNLERASVALRQNYYLPLKGAVKQGLEKVFSILDLKIL